MATLTATIDVNVAIAAAAIERPPYPAGVDVRPTGTLQGRRSPPAAKGWPAMAASARRKPRARRSAPARPTLEQRHWDLIGLGLVACAIFLAFLVYLGWEGGTAGSAVVDGLKDLVGAGARARAGRARWPPAR